MSGIDSKKKWREANIEKSNAINKESYYKHAEARKAKAKEYRDANKEKLKAYRKEYYERNKEKLRKKALDKYYGRINKDKIEKLIRDEIRGVYGLNRILNIVIESSEKHNIKDLREKYEGTTFEEINELVYLKDGEGNVRQKYDSIQDAVASIKNELTVILNTVE